MFFQPLFGRMGEGVKARKDRKNMKSQSLILHQKDKELRDPFYSFLQEI